MTSDQRNTIQAILVDRGLTFTPLREEMIDHIGCDVELLMESGRSFEEALLQTLDQIPAEHNSADNYLRRFGRRRNAGDIPILT